MKVKCIETAGYNFTYGKVYDISPTIPTDQFDWVELIDDKGHSVSAYASRFKELTMEDHITNAQKLIGKKVITSSYTRFTPTKVSVYLQGCLPQCLSIIQKLKTNPYVIAVEDNVYHAPYQDCVMVSGEVTVKLNNNHDAVVTKDNIKVGCQYFPVSIVEELKKALDSLK